MDFFFREVNEFCNSVNLMSDLSKEIENNIKKTDHSLSADDIKRRMAGIFAYKLSNYKEGEERERDARKERYEHDLFFFLRRLYNDDY
ncbi:hypothetical protein CASFOL_027399 [Castilleja foliolosa]|uniref:Uncharacterized protein n=1 Tax=Castilleja foliolosa TaxID=1961234 RepID=A0ABD3CFH8_9LAMI